MIPLPRKVPKMFNPKIIQVPFVSVHEPLRHLDVFGDDSSLLVILSSSEEQLLRFCPLIFFTSDEPPNLRYAVVVES